jgi:hypothetical protein
MPPKLQKNVASKGSKHTTGNRDKRGGGHTGTPPHKIIIWNKILYFETYYNSTEDKILSKTTFSHNSKWINARYFREAYLTYTFKERKFIRHILYLIHWPDDTAEKIMKMA